MSEDPTKFLPKTGNYRSLFSYRKSQVFYDFTFRFCEKASVTSAETEIKLTNVARASLEEILAD